jgi:hypothetical protein
VSLRWTQAPGGPIPIDSVVDLFPKPRIRPIDSVVDLPPEQRTRLIKGE